MDGYICIIYIYIFYTVWEVMDSVSTLVFQPRLVGNIIAFCSWGRQGL